MVFWRNRPTKKAETPVVVDAETSARENARAANAETESSTAQTNVVTLVTSRLADRLAGVAGLVERTDTPVAKSHKEPAAIEPAGHGHVFGQKRAAAKIRAALAAKPGEHLLILGEAGTGRLDLARALAGDASCEPADDWIYVIERHSPSRAKAFALPSGEGAQFVRAVRAAIERASAAFARQVRGEEHRISLDLLEEEMRHRGERAIEEVRRRAEAQNIAVVKSLDGYVLAPLHEGRVVRSDVFRALPESLKRNVEAKISVLEEELQSIVATLPDVVHEESEKFEALVRQAALRAVRPRLATVKKSFIDGKSATAALDAIEDLFLDFVATSGARIETSPPVTIIDCASVLSPASSEKPRVIVASDVSAATLLGEIGHDARGYPTLLPGYLVQAGSGIVIIEAWKLAADPQAWLALSGALASGEIAPRSGAGIAVKADPVPLAATVILIADDQSWSRIEAIEPGAARHFPHVAKLVTTVPIGDISEEEFVQGAARLAAGRGLKPLDGGVAPLIYKDAVRRGGGRVSLNSIPLLHVLQIADGIAEANSASSIRVSDVEQALVRRADGGAP